MSLVNQFFELFLDVWKQGILGINASEIVVGFLIFLIFYVLRRLFARFVIGRLSKIVLKSKTGIDDAVVEVIEGPLKFLPVVIGFFLASSYIDLKNEFQNFIDLANRTLITIFIFWFLHQLISPFAFLVKNFEQKLTTALVDWTLKGLKIIVIILGIVAILELWGIKVGPVIAGLGLFGVAVALGAQDLFKNLISGILVLVEKRFKIGDWILVDGIIEGIVEKIGFRSTTIRKFDKSLAIIPNFQFAENAVINISETSNWLISWIITLQYDTTVDQLKTIRNQIEEHINKSEDFNTSIGVAVRVDKFSDSSIDMYIRCFTKSDSWNEWLSVKEKLAIEIKQIVENNKASFAFPSSSIYIEKK